MVGGVGCVSGDSQAPANLDCLHNLISVQATCRTRFSYSPRFSPGAAAPTSVVLKSSPIVDRCGSVVVQLIRLVDYTSLRVSVNTTSAHRRPVFVDCHSRWLAIDRLCTHSLRRNDMAYYHFEHCGLGCFSELLLADI